MQRHPQPLTSKQVRVLASLCALKDSGQAPTATAAARRLDIDPAQAINHVVALRRKGWVANGSLSGGQRLLHIIIRPVNVRKQPGYQFVAPGQPSNRHPDDVPAIRDCLTCRRAFPSEGWHERMCPTCRKESGNECWMGEGRLP